MGELEKEGYDPSQAAPDEIICYLWQKKKRIKEDLEKTNKALRKKLGDKDFQLLQVKPTIIVGKVQYDQITFVSGHAQL